MGFCRRCGDIVIGARCQCGGAPVAPVLPWNRPDTPETATDRWSNTYIHRERAVSPTRTINTHTTISATTAASSPTKRFPRPISNHIASKSEIGNRVTAHIASTTSQSSRPPSPYKYPNILPAPESDILPSLSPYDTTLSKAYGSVLQPKESLATHSCAVCSMPFPPDATIYPDLNTIDPSRFLCKPCFTANGGSRGECPTCLRPVLALKSEGGFVHAANRYWHKRCFNCTGCFKNIGDSPMLDLTGHPSCVQCFDNCLKREPNTPKKHLANNYNGLRRNERTTNIGGMKVDLVGHHVTGADEGSPAIEELERRLGITKSREGSPALEELSQRLSMIGRDSSTRQTVSGNSPVANAILTRNSTQSRDSSPTAEFSKGRHESGPTCIQSLNRPYGRSKPIGSSNTNKIQASLVKGASSAPSPGQLQTTRCPTPTSEAIEEMKQRFMKGSYSPSTRTPIGSPQIRTLVHRSHSSTSIRDISTARIPGPVFDDGPPSPQSPAVPQTPDLMSDYSDTMTQSSTSGLDSSPRNNEGVNVIFDDPPRQISEETMIGLRIPIQTPKSLDLRKNNTTHHSKSLSIPTPLPVKPPIPKFPATQPLVPNMPLSEAPDLTTSTCCSSCRGYLFSVGKSGKFVTVPTTLEESTEPMLYHIECFRCVICDGIFKDINTGHAVFVRTNDGPCHAECAPPTKITIRKVPSLGSFHPRLTGVSPSTYVTGSSSSPTFTDTSSSRHDRLSTTSVHPTTLLPRFGSITACPGCRKSVSPMERGVVPGPQGTRWHTSCLVCGGKQEMTKGWRGSGEGKKKPGCRKQLDSAAKSGGDGGVWCRECLLLLGVGGSPQASPTYRPLVPIHTGSSKVSLQPTGTTIARQFTGLGGGKEAAIVRQLTGGGLSPTRSISPTKQLGVGGKPRPKSVLGMRNCKSTDEGRGMFLVRQLTGASSGGWIG